VYEKIGEFDHMKQPEELFLISALTEENPFITTNQVKEWLKDRNNSIHVSVKKVRFNDLDQWYFDYQKGVLRHISNKFFTIEGIRVNTNWGKIHSWEQPIINQPEIGFLGIITKEINGILYFILQAKVEPGNVNNVQLSPTLQATKSNYNQVHKGKKPLYLEYFQNAINEQKLIDQLQSEQGSRFLKKRNRNIIIKIDEDIPVHENFIWLTLGQIKKLIHYDNFVNMDTRTVISGIPFGRYKEKTIDLYSSLKSMIERNNFEQRMLNSALNSNYAMNSLNGILNWITDLKCRYELNISPVSLFEIDSWMVTDNEIAHKDGKYFKVIATQVEISSREVKKWSQPLIEPMQKGITVFIVKEINGVYHFLIQAKLECGNFDILEMAPTVQCLTGSYKNSKETPFLDYVLNASTEQIKYDTLQSEEGGRFYREQNRNIIIEADDQFPVKVPDNYIWVTLNQLNIFLKFNNYLNIQSRSLISAISFIE